MSDHNRKSERLAVASASRSLAAEHRVRDALRQLDREHLTINFASVARRADVSRNYLYNHPDFRDEIESLRITQNSTRSRLPVSARADDTNLGARLRTALEDNTRLRDQNKELIEELSFAHGRVRELELHARIGPPALATQGDPAPPEVAS